MTKVVLTDIVGGYASVTELNDNFTDIETAFDNTLSLDGSTPNAMGADLDMNSNDINNCNAIAAQSMTLNGVPVSASVVSVDAAAVANTPAGDIAATNIQAAINELDTEKLPLAGGAMTGAITTNSTFDGRDVATDGTALDAAVSKLAGIETAATADQTAADIRTLGFFDITNDGSGSGLDADKLDTYEASAFPRKAETATITAAWTMAAINMADSVLTRPAIKDYGITHTTPSSSAAAITFDCALGNSFSTTLTENITTITLSNPPASGTYGEIVIEFLQDGTGSWTVAWPASVKWAGGTAPVITTTATTGKDKVFLSTRDGGTTWLGDFSQDYS